MGTTFDVPVDVALEHHGIKGQKWGVRRFQNDDGSLTAAGKDRYRTNLSGETNEKNLADKIKSHDLFTESMARENKKRATDAADLGLKALTKMGRHDGTIDKDFRDWFIYEDQTVGLVTLADQVNQGRSSEEIKHLVRDANSLSNDYEYEPGFFQLRNAYGSDEFIDACFAVKADEKKNLKHFDEDDVDNYLMHFGIKGQRWGIRRFQNPDGTLTAAGRARYLTDGGLTKEGASAAADDLKRSEDKYWKYYDAKTKYDKKPSDKMKEKVDALKSDWEEEANTIKKKYGFTNLNELADHANKVNPYAFDKEKGRKREELDKVVAKGNAKQVERNLSELSNEEIQNAIERIKLSQEVRELATKPKNYKAASGIANFLDNTTKVNTAFANAGDSIKRIKKLFEKEKKEDDEDPLTKVLKEGRLNGIKEAVKEETKKDYKDAREKSEENEKQASDSNKQDKSSEAPSSARDAVLDAIRKEARSKLIKEALKTQAFKDYALKKHAGDSNFVNEDSKPKTSDSGPNFVDEDEDRKKKKK